MHIDDFDASARSENPTRKANGGARHSSRSTGDASTMAVCIMPATSARSLLPPAGAVPLVEPAAAVAIAAAPSL